MQRIIYRLLFFCLLLGTFNSAKAIDEKYAAPELRGSQLAPDSTSMVMDAVYFNPALKPLQTTWYVKNLITFQLDENYRHVLPNAFNVSVKFKIHYTQDVNGSPVTGVTDEITLGIEYTKNNTYQGKRVYFGAGWYRAEVEIISITGSGTLSDYRDALVLTNEILVNREYSFSCTNNTIRQIFANSTPVASKGELNVSWAPERAADEYDLEWTYIDSLALANYYKTANTTSFDPKKIFANNATRVSISRETYNIPLLYEASGLLFYRVRAVQVKRDGQRMESLWSSDYTGGLGQYGFAGLDTSLNWQASTSFAEEGKRKSVVQYFDGSLKSRQTVTKDNTTDTTIIAETFYDHQGRPAIQVMPTPSLSSIIKFTPGFNRLNSANEYPKDRYDSLLVADCYCNLGAPAMDTTQGAAQYYSPLNPLKTNGYHKYIPDAKGYVFAETRYTPDNTGRVSIQSGVGETFQIGKGHETVYTYNAADQEELDALFGTEVGNKSHYFKNTVRDANGQVSISYVDMHGRTIATALAGTPPVKLDALPSNSPYFITKKLIDSTSNVIKGTAIESSMGLVVTKAGAHRFIYSMVPDSIGIKGCDNNTVCYDCIYDLRITITDECNNTSLPNKQPYVITRTNGPADTTCGIPRSLPSVDDTVYLQEGSYLVTKTLTVNQQAMDYYRDSVFLVRNMCRTLEQTIQDQKNILVSRIQCEPSCATCTASLGSWETFRNNYMQQAGIPAGETADYEQQALIAYNKEKEECQQLCDGIIPLQVSIRKQMLADVTPPYGQYANPASQDPFGIYTSINGGEPLYKTTGIYKDENGRDESPDPRSMSQDDFIASFKDSWAETLLPLHPEYPKLVQFEKFATSNTWDQQFGKTETFQEAVAKGYLNPGNFNIHPPGSIFDYNANYRDPFFTDYIAGGIVTTGVKSQMQDSLLNKTHFYQTNFITRWSLATILAHCGGDDATCMDHYRSIDSAFALDAGCSGELDMAWKYFREMYLQKKRELIADILRAAQLGSPYTIYRRLIFVANAGHHLNFYDPQLMPTGDMPTTEQAVKDSIQTYINDNCAAYVNQWWQDLAPCGYSSTDSAWIIPRLIDVCREGGDADHFFGASTVKPSSTYPYKSFEEVLRAYSSVSGKSYNSTCNVYLISAPKPYDQQPIFTNKPVYQKPDSCECASIASLYQQYQSAGKDSSFADYLYRTTQTVVSNGALDTLRMACNGQISCNFLQAPVFLPPVLQCGVKDVCVPCSKFNTLYNKYLDQFPNATPAPDNGDSLQTENNKLFERFMNTNLGFGKSASEYLDFLDKCGIVKHGNAELIAIRDEFVNNYFNHGRKYDSNGCDTVSWKVDFGGWDNNTGQPHKNIFRNGIMQFPDTLSLSHGHTRVDYDHYLPLTPPDSACINGYVNLEIRMRDTLTEAEKVHYFLFWLLFNSTSSNEYIVAVNKRDPYWSYVHMVTGKVHDSVARNISEFPQLNYNGWHTINIEVKDSLFNYYFDKQLVKSIVFPKWPREKFFGYSFTSVSDSNLSIAYDYVRCYDRNGNMFYNEEFNDCGEFARFAPYMQCPKPPCKEAFTAYYNKVKQTEYTWSQIASIYEANNVTLNICDTTEAMLCGKSEPVIVSNDWKPRTACDDSTLFATSTGVLLHEAYRDSLLGSFNDRYLAKCLNARYNESFTVYQPVSEYHYTLYYYDQAGNLLKTVPPEGVDVSKFAYASAWSDSVKIARRNKQLLTPNHHLPTQYRYNTLNQVVAQQSPDGGLSEFWYDRLGRLAISRNARQKGASGTEENRLYSYTKYDSLGRITEVGQVSNRDANGAMSETISRNQPLLTNWLLALNNRRGQITNTVYDLPFPGFIGGVVDPRMVITQRNLRNRVSYTTLTDTGSNNAYNSGTFYTYDILGNVDHLLQDYGSSLYGHTANVMNKNGNGFKKISYQYDLISGKVNMVILQQGYREAFFHRYGYDAENRLTLVETSGDSLVWEKDARYDYYRHGPLARVTLGDQQVQGLDYAYTLQGWLKGINSTGGTDSFDMGEDGHMGSMNQFTARDAVGLTLNYFGNDYSAINGTPFPAYSAFMPTGAFKPLYNGNISSSSVYQKKFEGEPGGPLIFYNYQYDQLNRLTGQDAYKGFSSSTNSWSNLTSMGENLKERIAYDANGNILKYLRKSLTGTGDMDSLNYYYYPGTNRLKRITDSISPNTYVHADKRIIDIDNQLDSNYAYDAIGNLIKDSAEQITSIKWSVYGKIQEIAKAATAAAPATNIKYTYDALGNRIGQVVASGGTKYYTWYVRDAQGNILSTYTADGNYLSLDSLRLKLVQHFLYGSSRLGYAALVDDNVDGGPDNAQNLYQNRSFGYERGFKQYELTNHLGNVLATISDRKIGVSSGSSSLIDHYEPHIVTAQDYYPFGMLSRVELPTSGVAYKFGFNGKLNDNEVKGLGDQQDYGMRVYDPRIGKFLSVDPLTKDYPELTPYQFASNRPIDGVDLDGEEYLKTIPKFEYSGNNTWVDYVSAIDNGGISIVNLVPTTWNGIVNTVKSIGDGSYVEKLTDETKQAASSIKQTARDFVKAPLTTMTSPQAVEFFTNAFIGAKIFAPTKSTGNLMKPVTAEAATTEAQAAANSGKAVSIRKPIVNAYQGGEFIDDAIRTVDQPLEVEVTLKSSYWIQRSKMSSLNRMIKGQYAEEFVAGDNTRNFSSIQPKLNEIGAKYGCHTCGVKSPGTKTGNWIPDHQPSLKLNPNGPFKLYPHCKQCSVTQGGQVLQAAKKR